MLFELTEEQRLVQDTAGDSPWKILPLRWRRKKETTNSNWSAWQEWANSVFFSCVLPEELGGNGMGYFESVLMAEQISQVSASWRLPFNMQNLGAPLSVARYGTDEQKQKYIPGWIDGTKIGFFAMTEPDTGSDVASMKTHAIDRGDHYELHGSKIWISNAHVGDAGLLYAYTDREKGNKGISCFIIEPKNLDGCSARPIETKLGLHCSPTGEFVFEGARIPKHALLGELNNGFKMCMWQLNNTRIGCAAGALGVAGGALQLAIDYANERKQFGKAISRHQMIQSQIADMVLEHQAAQLLVYKAAWLKDQGKPNQYETSVAKLAASEAAVHAANECMKIFGSYGYSTEYPAEPLLSRRQVTAGGGRDIQYTEGDHRRHGLRAHPQSLTGAGWHERLEG